MTGKYDDIIHLPHHVSSTRARMPARDRAAQFSPFAALTGYEDVVREAARLTDRRGELDEDRKEALNEKLRAAAEGGHAVTVTYFLPDGKKEGGGYVSAAGRVWKWDPCERAVLLTGGIRIPVEDIWDVEEVQPELPERSSLAADETGSEGI